jgi:hypothetical protein
MSSRTGYIMIDMMIPYGEIILFLHMISSNYVVPARYACVNANS